MLRMTAVMVDDQNNLASGARAAPAGDTEPPAARAAVHAHAVRWVAIACRSRRLGCARFADFGRAKCGAAADDQVPDGERDDAEGEESPCRALAARGRLVTVKLAICLVPKTAGMKGSTVIGAFGSRS